MAISGRGSRRPRSAEAFQALAERGARAERPAAWSLTGLRAQCARLAVGLLEQGAPIDDVEPWYPGGEQNPGRDRRADLICAARYQYLKGRLDVRREQAGPASDAVFQRAVADAARDVPQYVECADGVRRGVYPKSFHALEECDRLDAAIARMVGVDLAEAALASDVFPQLLSVPALRSLAARLFCWVVTHPAPGLPWEDDADDPTPPAWTADLAPQDLLALVHAHRTVNRERLAILCAAFPRDPEHTPSRLGFEGFLTTFAGGKSLDPLIVLRRWSLGRVLATAVSEAVAHDESRRKTAKAA